MKFTEWWDANVSRLGWYAHGVYRYYDIKQWAERAYADGIREGLRRAQVALEPPYQGGGSQEAATDALKPISVNKS